MILLTPKLVSQVIREEARRAGSSFDAVVNLGRRAKDISARTNALQRLMRETGCNREELAEAWGCSERTITNTLNPKPPPHPPAARPDSRAASLGARRRTGGSNPSRARSGNPDGHHGMAPHRREG